MKNIKLLFFVLSFSFLGATFAQEGKDKVPFAEHYKGGIDSLYADIHKIMQYPGLAKRNRIQGKTIVHCTIMEDGTVKNIGNVNKIGGGCDAEAIRIVQELAANGKVIAPGYQANFNIPIYFKL